MSITLKTSDNKALKASPEVLKLSKFLSAEIESGSKEITLSDINGETLEYVLKYMEHYSEEEYGQIPEVLTNTDLKTQLCDFDFNFIDDINYEQAFLLINAAVVLQLHHLHDLACAKIAAFMKGKSPEEVNKEFTIECQLTQEEAKELGLDGN